MAINFSNTLAAIDADLNRLPTVIVIIPVLLIVLWLAWSAFVPMTVTRQAAGQVEINQPVYSLVSPVAGRIHSVAIKTGDEVEADQLLIQLNSEEESQQISLLQESVSRQQDALAAQQKTQESEVQSIVLDLGALQNTITNALAQSLTVQEQFEQQQETVKMLSSATAAVSRIEFQREQLQLKSLQERLLVRKQDVADLYAKQQQLQERQKLLNARIAQENANHNAMIAHLKAQLNLQHQAFKRKELRISSSAIVAETMPLQVGQWVEAGEVLATLFPQGDLRVIAYFKPADAQGYVLVGQRAQVKVDNFPWLQYGTLTATVIQVDRAVRNDSIRVVLALDSSSTVALPLEHGMTTSVNVFTARLTPWQLLLHSLGRQSSNSATKS